MASRSATAAISSVNFRSIRAAWFCCAARCSRRSRASAMPRFAQNNFVSGLLTSLQIGIAAMIGGLLLGIPASLALARRKFVGREALNTLLVLPLVVPGIVAGTAIYVFQI